MKKSNEVKLLEEILANIRKTDEKATECLNEGMEREDKFEQDTFNFEVEFQKALSELTVDLSAPVTYAPKNPLRKMMRRKTSRKPKWLE